MALDARAERRLAGAGRALGYLIGAPIVVLHVLAAIPAALFFVDGAVEGLRARDSLIVDGRFDSGEPEGADRSTRLQVRSLERPRTLTWAIHNCGYRWANNLAARIRPPADRYLGPYPQWDEVDRALEQAPPVDVTSLHRGSARVGGRDVKLRDDLHPDHRWSLSVGWLPPWYGAGPPWHVETARAAILDGTVLAVEARGPGLREIVLFDTVTGGGFARRRWKAVVKGGFE
jgi:hypothetical protein